MRKFIIIILSLISIHSQAQTITGTTQKDLPKIYINEKATLHFISLENIEYTDLSTEQLQGDFPMPNLVRIRMERAPNNPFQSIGIVTIVAKSFMAQYEICYTPRAENTVTRIVIQPEHTLPIATAPGDLSEAALKEFALTALQQKQRMHAVYSTQYGLSGAINNVFTVDNYIFMDITFTNKTNIKYDIDQIRFKIEDKKIVKATNVQAVEVEPTYQLYEPQHFKRKFRNIYVFKKFTYPNNKVLTVELSEDQISGRTLKINLDYSDLLAADTL